MFRFSLLLIGFLIVSTSFAQSDSGPITFDGFVGNSCVIDLTTVTSGVTMGLDPAVRVLSGSSEDISITCNSTGTITVSKLSEDVSADDDVNPGDAICRHNGTTNNLSEGTSELDIIGEIADNSPNGILSAGSYQVVCRAMVAPS